MSKMSLFSFLTILVFFICILNGSGSVKPEDNVNSTFTPSHQWKKVEEGQAIPPGLHVRINLHTGQKEAKLLEGENNENSKKSLIVTGQPSEENKGNTYPDTDSLKKLLKNMKYGGTSSSESDKRKFRTYEELKEEFGKLKAQMKTDLEILTGLIESFKKFNVIKVKDVNNNNSNSTEDEDILTVLVDLEYLVHQYDNAQEFAKLNGFQDVVYKSLNSSNSEIRSEALRLLGSATQSNPKVQISALDSGSMHLLLKIFTLDDDINVRSRSLYALSCLIRRFPAAQQKLITNGGLSAFAKVFDEEKQNLIKLQIKIITLIHDLLFERKDTKMNILEEENKNQTDMKIENLRERLRQYEKMDLEKKLVEQEWCKRIPEWFLKQNHVKEVSKNLNTFVTINFDSHDIIEKVIDTLYVLSDICKSQFQSDSDLLNLLFTLRDIYSKLAAEESKKDVDANQFYTSLSNILKMLIDKLTEAVKKDEL